MGVKVRASTQIFDDGHLMLSATDLEKLNKAVISDPGSGEHKIYAIKRLDDGTYTISWDDTPEI